MTDMTVRQLLDKETAMLADVVRALARVTLALEDVKLRLERLERRRVQ